MGIMSMNRKLQDELLFCERCGISFLWTSEEQKAAITQAEPTPVPVLCAGCRQLLPPTGRERGIVKWYNGRKHFGFITRRSGPELYLHNSELPPGTRLTVGDLVEFQVDANERGPLARAVRVLAQGAGSEGQGT
jgi:cold shock protein